MTDTADALDGVDPEHVLFLTRWAAKHGAVVDFAGQCGFGRECVGVKVGGTYLDYAHLWDLFGRDQARWASWWTPEDSYHKHPCMAVLGRGPGAVAQLCAWAKFLDGHGWRVVEEYREPANALEAVLHGLSTPKLMPPAPQAADAGS